MVAWLVAAIMAILALQQAIAGARARHEVAVANMQADLARAQAEQSRQQLEAERIIAAREIAILRGQAQPAASATTQAPQASHP